MSFDFINFKPVRFLVLFLLVHTVGAFGQAMMSPYWLYDNHYLVDKYVINPAFAGIQYYPKAFIGTQRAELQLSDAPAIHIAGVHSRLGIGSNYSNEYKTNDRSARNAVGGLLFADNNGPFQSVGAKLDYAYHVPLNQSTSLSFGLSGMLFSKRIRLNRYDAMTAYDPLIAESTGNNVMLPDFNAGIVLYHRQFYAGFSVSQLMENAYQSSKLNYTPAQVYRNYYLQAGYRFIYSGFELEPSVVAGHNLAPENHSNNGNFVDINIECFLKPVVFTISYRANGFITTAFQYRTPKLELGIRAELFSTNSSDARLSGIGLMASYTFLPANDRKN